MNSSLREHSIHYRWSHDILAWVYILLLVGGNLLGRLSAKNYLTPYSDFSPLLIIPLSALVLSRAQGAINHACGDPLGETNSSLSVANYAWVAAGIIFWLLFSVGLTMILFFPELVESE